MNKCQYCGNYHSDLCSKIKAIEYHPNGTVKRIEFFDVAPVRQEAIGWWWTVPQTIGQPYTITCSGTAGDIIENISVNG